MAEHNSQEIEEDLENTKEVVAKFEEKLNTRVRKQEKLEMVEERDFRREELLEKYIAKILYEQNNKKFKEKYLIKLEKDQQKWKSVSLEEKY